MTNKSDSDPDRGSQTLSEQLTNKSGIEGPRLTNQGKKVPDSDPDRGSQTLSEQLTNKSGIVINILRGSQTLSVKLDLE